jgi:hypothetical protein
VMFPDRRPPQVAEYSLEPILKLGWAGLARHNLGNRRAHIEH